MYTDFIPGATLSLESPGFRGRQSRARGGDIMGLTASMCHSPKSDVVFPPVK